MCCYANTVSERHKLQTRKENPQKVTSKASTDLPHQQSFLVHSWASFWDEIPSRQSSTGRKSAQPISLQPQSRDIPVITTNTINDVRFLLTVLSTGRAKVRGRLPITPLWASAQNALELKTEPKHLAGQDEKMDFPQREKLPKNVTDSFSGQGSCYHAVATFFCWWWVGYKSWPFLAWCVLPCKHGGRAGGCRARAAAGTGPYVGKV